MSSYIKQQCVDNSACKTARSCLSIGMDTQLPKTARPFQSVTSDIKIHRQFAGETFLNSDNPPSNLSLNSLDTKKILHFCLKLLWRTI